MRKRIGPGSILAVLLLAAMPAWAAPPAIPPGDGRQQAELPGRVLPVFTYRPHGCAPRVLLLVFHGTSRNAAAYARMRGRSPTAPAPSSSRPGSTGRNSPARSTSMAERRGSPPESARPISFPG